METEPPSFTVVFQNLETNLPFGIIVTLILLITLGLFSRVEIVFFSLSSKDLEDAHRKDISKSKLIILLLEKPKKLLATLLVANNFLSISVVLLFFNISSGLFSNIVAPTIIFILKTILIAFLLFVFGEVFPKIYLNRNNLKFTLFFVRPLFILDRLLSPISLPMRAATIYLHEKLGKQKSNFSVGQLSQALELTTSDETSHGEQKILEGIVSFGNTDTKQVMSPRIDIFAIEINESFEKVLPKIIEKQYSRIPVYDESIDYIVGILFVKDLIPYIDSKDFDWKVLLREPFFVPENKKLDNLLKDFQSMKNHLAIVVDEYGGTSGLVSLEDVIEEIVGDISDEFDGDDLSFSQIDTKNYLFEGKINLKDFYRVLDVDEVLFEENKGEAETLAGFLLEIHGNFPKVGHKLTFGNCTFEIEMMDKKRIKQIKVTIE